MNEAAEYDSGGGSPGLARRLWNRLVLGSGREIVRHKSFLLLIAVVRLIDYAIGTWAPGLEGIDRPEVSRALREAGVQVFEELPGEIVRVMADWRTPGILLGLFLVKELISLWPSSDMRHMHRRERGQFGLLRSLVALRWRQFAYDATAVSTTVGVTGAGIALGFVVCQAGWGRSANAIWVLIFGGWAGLVFPLGMAGFSYSSKLAVVSRGTFAEKLRLFLRLYHDRRVLPVSWVFYSFRAGLEALVFGALPMLLRLGIAHDALRVALTSVVAIPVYSYLKMLSFRVFLEVYRPFPLVRAEYAQYYRDATGAEKQLGRG